jgi:threonyl-tRNA synthetase
VNIFLFQGAACKPEDYEHLEKIMKNAVKDRQTFERLELSKDELREMFKYNKFKVCFLCF